VADDPQAGTIAFLSDSATYGIALGTVERHDTHGAIVFLAGDRAYKLKRAVKFPYMDFSTLERRRRFCEAEVALNRRTAPELYLGTEPIVRRPSGELGLGGAGEPVDWIVIMRRFDQSALFDDMARRGRLDVATVLELAGEIARFHAGAEPAPEFGGCAGLRAVATGNALSLRAGCDGALDRADIEPLVEATTRAIDRVCDLADRRRAAGKVRRCHGDLHLRNICLVEGRPTLFDCIEFDDAIACIDVIYDLAFLLMDLWHRGLGPHANAVFNRYLDLADEADALEALPLFLSLRAAVRAHVGAAALVRQPAGTREAALSAMREETRRYLAEARRFLAPSPPVMLAVGGLSGTGKSTLAYGLAPGVGAPPGARVLRSDVLRKRILGVPWDRRLPEAAYSDEVTERVYARLRAEAADALVAGHAVIADAVFARPAQREAIAAVAAGRGVPFCGLWLEAAPQILERRVGGRRADVSDATVAVLRRQLVYDIGRLGWTRVDAGGEEAEVLAAARRAMEGGSA
jgi:aminoglycoside phosphotransferase family enzyme/predicted kinase